MIRNVGKARMEVFMKDLSFMQEYYICVVKKNGNLPTLNFLSAAVCFGVGGIMELSDLECIARDEKGIFSVAKPFGGNAAYLKPIYETLARFKESADIESVVTGYISGADIYVSAMFITSCGRARCAISTGLGTLS